MEYKMCSIEPEHPIEDIWNHMEHIEFLANQCGLKLNPLQKDPTNKWLENNDTARGTGRTTLLVLYYVSKAIKTPWETIRTMTHEIEVPFCMRGRYAYSHDIMAQAIWSFLSNYKHIETIKSIKEHLAIGINTITIAYLDPRVPVNPYLEIVRDHNNILGYYEDIGGF